MPKVNVYLPDYLATAVRQASIPVSTVCQRALEDALREATALHEGARAGMLDLPAGIRLPKRATSRLAHALELAVEEAGRRNHGFVGTEHLLLGMLAEGANLGLRVIEALDVAPADLKAELEAVMQRELAGAVSGTPALTTGAQRACHLMAKEADQLKHNYLGCEHLLLGLIRETDGVAGRVLRTMGLDLAVTRRTVLNALAGVVHSRANPQPAPAAVETALADIADRLTRLEARLERR